MTYVWQRPNAASLAFLGGLLFSVFMCSTALADSPKVYLIEEEWEMEINDPAPATNSPQVAFFMYPDSSHEDIYFQLQMNYAAEESYSSGGFRVAAVSRDVSVDHERSVTRETLNMDGDKLRWTSAMAVWNGKLMYAVKNGTGTQWGAFGGPNYLVEMNREGIDILNDYDPTKSVESVDIGFGANRVAKITLKSVRYVYTNGTSHRVTLNQAAH